MKVVFTKKDLLEALEGFDDSDSVTIEIHDKLLGEDLYQFYLDPIHMGLDENGDDRGYEIRLSILDHDELNMALIDS